MSPDPDAGKPIDGSLFDHVKTVPATGPVVVVAETGAPAQTN
jgi:hypothetical protein